VYGIVQDAGGHIEVRSTPGAGTTFEIALPAAPAGSEPAPPPHRPREDAASDPSMSPSPHGTRETIVVADDDPAIVSSTARTLRRERYRVLEVERGEHALGVVRALRDDVALVITDGEMPGMSGLDVFRALRTEGHRVPVILASGSSEWETEAARDGSEVPEFLAKPFLGADLVAKVRGVLAIAARKRGTSDG
jgi:CheY-like chemotaxis protein